MPAIIKVKGKNERKANLENSVYIFLSVQICPRGHKSIYYIHARQYIVYSLTQVDQQADKDTNLLISLA